MSYAKNSSDHLSVALAVVEGEHGIKPIAHAFVGSKAEWHEPNPCISSFDSMPDGVGDFCKVSKVLMYISWKNYMSSFSQISSTLSTTSLSISMGVPHSLLVSPGHLFVASIPIFEPRPDTGDAKSK